jgi:hypothetical protein
MKLVTFVAAVMFSTLPGIPAIAMDAFNGGDAGRNSNQNAVMIETLFYSLCEKAPDPASLNFYLNALEKGPPAIADVHDAIARSCQPPPAFKPCEHASGLNGLCGQPSKTPEPK